MYLESSDHQKKEKGILVSSDFTNSVEPECLTFWYHMYGRDTDYLSVILVRSGQRLRLSCSDFVLAAVYRSNENFKKLMYHWVFLSKEHQTARSGINMATKETIGRERWWKSLRHQQVIRSSQSSRKALVTTVISPLMTSSYCMDHVKSKYIFMTQ